jgi:hypothetical protein
MPDAAVTHLIRDTDVAVPSLETLAKKAIVDTNPLADWANTHLIRQADRDEDGRLTTSVNVGIARKAEHSDRYEHEDIWLYPNYRAWVDGTGNKYVSMRRFTTTLEDLLVTQLGFDVEHHHDNRGSSFRGIQLRPLSHKGDPLFYDHKHAQWVDGMDTVMDNTLASDGCDGCMDFFKTFYMHEPPPPVAMGGDHGQDTGCGDKGVGGGPIGEGVQPPENPSHQAPTPHNPSPIHPNPALTRASEDARGSSPDGYCQIAPDHRHKPFSPAGQPGIKCLSCLQILDESEEP